VLGGRARDPILQSHALGSDDGHAGRNVITTRISAARRPFQTAFIIGLPQAMVDFGRAGASFTSILPSGGPKSREPTGPAVVLARRLARGLSPLASEPCGVNSACPCRWPEDLTGFTPGLRVNRRGQANVASPTMAALVKMARIGRGSRVRLHRWPEREFGHRFSKESRDVRRT
jgi:hypothetical protein